MLHKLRQNRFLSEILEHIIPELQAKKKRLLTFPKMHAINRAIALRSIGASTANWITPRFLDASGFHFLLPFELHG